MAHVKFLLQLLLCTAIGVGLQACVSSPTEPGEPGIAGQCIPGQTEVCACIDGSKGAQECKADKTFAGCVCGDLPSPDAGTQAPPVDAGTSTVPTSNLCVPGRSIECACSDGRSGAQVCDNAGTYGACTCTGGMMDPPDTGTMPPAPIDAGMTPDTGMMPPPPDAGFNGNCPPRFTGVNCDQCIGNFTGPTCSACAPGFTGLNCDECANPRFTGALCNQCAQTSVTGPNCDQWGFQKIATGNDHVCGIKNDGTVLCWGQNHLGQAVNPIGQFMDITAGAFYTCGLRMSGEVECWGDNNGNHSSPPMMTSFTSIDAPRSYTVGHVCGVLSSGAIACWGDFQQGIIPSGTDFAAVGTGEFHQCALKNDGSIACWGSSTGSSNLPSSEVFTSISTYDSGNCGITNSGQIRCWGNPGFAPQMPPFGTDFIDVSLGDNHACAIKTDNSLICWGQHYLGQTSPPTGSFQSVKASTNYNCARKLDDSVSCWGVNTVNQANPPTP